MGPSTRRRLKVLISAYACEPAKGSEPGVGWNTAVQMAKYHNVTVITRANNRKSIEDYLRTSPIFSLRFAYYDLPAWLAWWKRGTKGVQLYYYLWQVGMFYKVRSLHHSERYDLIHHATFVKYWAPSFLSWLSAPFLWGPVGGGESSPEALWSQFSIRARVYERARVIARRVAEWDPFVRITARKSVLALATTAETAKRITDLGARQVRVFSQCGLSAFELHHLSSFTVPEAGTIRFISIGRLLHWKGFHLGLQAFAKADIRNAEYWIIGQGPEKASLQRLALSLGIERHVRFLGSLPRMEAWEKLRESHVLIHPSLHDSGGLVCLEAMAAGRPVVCLATGGPATCVNDSNGFQIPITEPEPITDRMAQIMELLATNGVLRQRLGECARESVASQYSWEYRGRQLNAFYVEASRRMMASK